MTAAHAEWPYQDERYLSDYEAAFEDFMRHMRRQGFPVSDRILEGAHERATVRAMEQSKARGMRSADFAGMSRIALSRALFRYGY
jgi:hypothetical protein